MSFRTELDSAENVQMREAVDKYMQAKYPGVEYTYAGISNSNNAKLIVEDQMVILQPVGGTFRINADHALELLNAVADKCAEQSEAVKTIIAESKTWGEGYRRQGIDVKVSYRNGKFTVSSDGGKGRTACLVDKVRLSTRDLFAKCRPEDGLEKIEKTFWQGIWGQKPNMVPSDHTLSKKIARADTKFWVQEKKHYDIYSTCPKVFGTCNIYSAQAGISYHLREENGKISLYAQSQFGTYTIDGKNFAFERNWNNAISKMFDEKDMAKKAVYANNALTNFSSKKGGYFLGDTLVYVPTKQEAKITLISPHGNSFAEWKTAFDTEIEKFRDSLEQYYFKKYKDNMPVLTALLNGDAIVWHIMEIVRINEKYITANAVVQMLRHVSIQLNSPLTEPTRLPNYNIYTADEIEDIIHALIQSGALNTKTLKGTYGRFEILRPGNGYVPTAPIPRGIKEIMKVVTAAKIITTAECKLYFDSRKKLKVSPKHYMELMFLLKRKDFLVKYKDEFIAYMRTADPGVLEYLKLLKTDNSIQPYEKKILTEITKKQKK